MDMVLDIPEFDLKGVKLALEIFSIWARSLGPGPRSRGMILALRTAKNDFREAVKPMSQSIIINFNVFKFFSNSLDFIRVIINIFLIFCSVNKYLQI
jgi:hypothetical protein